MPLTLAMHENSLAHISNRLDALQLDVNIVTFNDDGQFTVAGNTVSPAAVVADYFWLSVHIGNPDAREKAFETALACQSIKVLQTFNAGLDNPFYKKLSDKGTQICNSSAQAVAISEYVMAQALSLIHPVDQQRSQQTIKEWKLTPFREVSRMNWLVIGYGPIGKEVAKRVKAFGTSVSVIRRSGVASEYSDATGTMADLTTLLPNADVIVIACPLNPDTRGFANTEFFDLVKQGAVLINIARGALIDESALIAALDDDRLDAAVLDVFHEEPLPIANKLWSHPKVRLTPHTSFSGDGVQDRWDHLFLSNIVRFVDGDSLLSVVNPDDLV